MLKRIYKIYQNPFKLLKIPKNMSKSDKNIFEEFAKKGNIEFLLKEYNLTKEEVEPLVEAFGYSWTRSYSNIFFNELKLPRKYYHILAPFQHSTAISLGEYTKKDIETWIKDKKKLESYKK